MDRPAIELTTLQTADDLAQARQLVRDYAASLTVDLCFQGFEAELAQLSEHYAAPRGCFLLVRVEGVVAGCGALRPLPDAGYAKACEMKRLFVRPEFRHLRLGRRLAQTLIDEARVAGYENMLLDTLDSMTAARGLYARLGFEEIPAYCVNPIPGAHYLKLALVTAGYSHSIRA